MSGARRSPRASCAFVLVSLAFFWVSGCGGDDDDAAAAGSASAAGAEQRAISNELFFRSALNVEASWTVVSSVERDGCGLDPLVPLERDVSIAQRGEDLALTVADDDGVCRTFALELSGRDAIGRFDRTVRGAAEDDGTRCVVEVATTTGVSFDRDVFEATEENVVRYVSGDCGALDADDPACTWTLVATGEACEGCTPACAEPSPDGVDVIGGPFASTVGAGPDALGR